MAEGLNPFFKFFGGKWRAGPKYPEPKYDTIIEPFAGSAGYSVRHFKKQIKLFDKDEKICGTWSYLINVTEEEIFSIPTEVAHVDDLKGPQEQKWLVGWWLNAGTTSPSKIPSVWMRSKIRPNCYWGESARNKIARQIQHIRHWTISQKSFEEIENENATWFIDPPYQNAGRSYRHSSKNIDFQKLATWCKSRDGQVLVCENSGADWLPFSFFADIKGTEGRFRSGRSKEVLWEK
jgi:site-specific DNA-adenine methylase